MKKFLLLTIALAAVFASAQAKTNLTFYIGNTEITPGQTVEFTDITINEEDGYREVVMKPDLYLLSNIYCSSIKIVADCTSGQEIGLCAGGKCIGGKTVTKENVTVRSGQKLELGFDYGNDFDLDEEIPTVVTTISAEDAEEEGSKVQFVITMGQKTNSVTAIEVNDVVKAVDGGIAYAADQETQFTVTTLSGVTVFSGTVKGEGVVALSKGFYAYSFGTISGKIYIK